MVKTPTWHVFNLFKDHQGAELVDSCIETECIGTEEEHMVPNLTESASVDADGKLTITIGNLSVSDSYPVETFITGFAGKKACAQILTNEMHAMNTFDNPENVKTADFAVDLNPEDGTLRFEIPACSVVRITVEE